MARMVRSRPRASRGIGEFLSEWFVYIVIIAGLVAAGRWYFLVYLPGPSHALSVYLNAVGSGDYRTQYQMLRAAEKRFYGDAGAYDNKCPLGHGLAARVENFTITKMTENGNHAEADVSMVIRRTGEKIYQSATDTYTDHYVLVHEADGWKVALAASKIQSLAAISTGR
ncbi:MAG: hypothetical protein ACP5VE_14590 [Chthonomonadales bacterium]